jgi:hypothetical protein
MTEPLILDINRAAAQARASSYMMRRVLLSLGGMCLALSLWAIHVGWKNSIFDSYSFRQCQTAISARAIQEGGPFLAYETPVLGPPWSIPFEFPLYQGLVAWLSHIFPVPLEQTGRFLSAFFFYATLFPLYFCLGALRVERRHRIVCLGLFALSPFYIFWSRSFMMESTALFFSVAYLALVLQALPVGEGKSVSAWIYTAIAITGSLAGAVKVTTYASFLMAGTFAILLNYWRQHSAERLLRKSAVLLIVSCFVPFVLTTVWTHYADSLKSKNPMAAWLTSKALTAWNFGTLQQRLTLANYARFGPVIDSILGNRMVLALACVGLIFVPALRRKHFLLCLALWASGILIFFNLHYVHTYYAYANGIFLVAAVGIVIIGLLERSGAWSWIGIYFLAACMGAFVVQYVVGLYNVQRINFRGTSAAAEILNKATKPDDVLLVYGLDWSSELPYEAHRRAIMDRNGFAPDPSLKFALDHLAPLKLGGVVICGPTRNYPDPLDRLLQSLAFQTRPYASASDCDIYVH